MMPMSRTFTTSLFVVFAFCSVVALAARKPYQGYSVIKTSPQTNDEVAFLRNLMLSDDELDFWAEPSRIGAEVKVMVSPQHVDDVTRQLRAANIDFRFVTRNVQKNVDRNKPLLGSSRFAQMDLNEFNTLTKIYRWLNQTASSCRQGVQCEVYSIGQTYEGRPMYVIKISKPGPGRKAYWIDSTIHAREWMSTATAVKIIDHLAKGGDANARRLVDKYDWYILPVMNPDGYSYTFTNERYWRKNRRPNPGSSCDGTDLNRNYDYNWGTEGVSFNPCSQVFCGSGPGSEVETANVKAEAHRLSSSLRGLLTLHTYGRMFMFPFATTIDHEQGSPCERVPDHQDLMDVANAAADAIQNTHGSNRWSRGNTCEVIYAAAGGSIDYLKAVDGVKYSFVAELRGNDFVIRKGEIQASFEEVWNGVVAMCDAIAEKEGDV